MHAVNIKEFSPDSIHFTTITHIIWVHYKQKDDCFKNCLACVPKDKYNQENLGAYEDKEVGDWNPKYNQPGYHNDHSHKDV